MKGNDEKLGKFDGRVDEGVFMGYSNNNKGYIYHNKFNKRIIDWINVKVYVHDD